MDRPERWRRQSGRVHPNRTAATARRFVAAILGKYTKVPTDVLLAMHHNTGVPRLGPALVQPVIDASATYQTLPRGFPAGELFYPGLD